MAWDSYRHLDSLEVLFVLSSLFLSDLLEWVVMTLMYSFPFLCMSHHLEYYVELKLQYLNKSIHTPL